MTDEARRDDGGAAFPFHVSETPVSGSQHFPGMSLRDCFAEMLPTGEVSLTACRVVAGETRDISSEVVPNDERVPWAVDQLVEKATGMPNREAEAA